MMTRLMSFLLLAGCTSLASQAVNPNSSDTPAVQVSTSQLKNSRFHIVLDYHYNLGLSQRIGSQTQGRNETYRMGGNSLHLTALYDFTEKFSAGAGIGADRYTNTDFNTFPVYAAFRYRPLSRIPAAYVYTNAGYGLFKSVNIYAGWMGDLGIGYQYMLRKHFGLNFQLGYNLKEFAGIESYAYDPSTGQTTFWERKVPSAIRFPLASVWCSDSSTQNKVTAINRD